MESLSQHWLQKGGVGWIFPGNSQPGAALLSAGDGHSPSFAPNLGLPSLLLRGWDSQLLPGQEDGEGHEEEKHLHPGAQVSLGLEENFPQPGQKVQRVPKGLVLGHRNWIFFFLTDLKNRDLATDSCGFRARGLRALHGVSHNKGERKKK